MANLAKQEMVDLLKALGEYNRLSLVQKLCSCKTPQKAMCLCECCNVDPSVASRHLKILAEADVILFEKKGREKIYSLNRKKIAQSLRTLADQIEGQNNN